MEDWSVATTPDAACRVLVRLPADLLCRIFLLYKDGVLLARAETVCTLLRGLATSSMWRDCLVDRWGWLLRQKPPALTWKALYVRLHTGAESCFCIVGGAMLEEDGEGFETDTSCAFGFRPAQACWEPLPAPAATREMAAIVREPSGALVVMGGTSPSVDDVGMRYFKTLDTVEMYEGGAWVSLASMHEPRCCCSGALDSAGGIFVVGGGASMYRGAECLNTVEHLPSVVGPANWVPGPVMGSARCALGVAISHDTQQMFALGGYSGELAYLDTCESVGVDAGVDARWAPLPSMAHKRAGCNAACGPDGRVYVLGGGPDGRKCWNTMEMLDPRTARWQLSAARLNWCRHYNAAAFGPDGFLYVSGAFRHSGQLDVVERYDPRVDRWEKLADIGSVVKFSAGVFRF